MTDEMDSFVPTCKKCGKKLYLLAEVFVGKHNTAKRYVCIAENCDYVEDWTYV